MPHIKYKIEKTLYVDGELVHASVNEELFNTVDAAVARHAELSGVLTNDDHLTQLRGIEEDHDADPMDEHDSYGGYYAYGNPQIQPVDTKPESSVVPDHPDLNHNGIPDYLEAMIGDLRQGEDGIVYTIRGIFVNSDEDVINRGGDKFEFHVDNGHDVSVIPSSIAEHHMLLGKTPRNEN